MEDDVVGKDVELVVSIRQLRNTGHAATREQSDASRSVAAGMEEVNSMIQNVNTACDEQRKESRQIVDAVTGIRKAAQANLDSTAIVSDASDALKTQTRMLLQAIGKFKSGTERKGENIVSLKPGRDFTNADPEVSGQVSEPQKNEKNTG